MEVEPQQEIQPPVIPTAQEMEAQRREEDSWIIFQLMLETSGETWATMRNQLSEEQKQLLNMLVSKDISARHDIICRLTNAPYKYRE